MLTTRTVVGAVDIGGTKIAVGLVDAAGAIVLWEECPTAAHDGFEAAMNRIAVMLEGMRSQCGLELSGIGIGCTGPIDPLSGEIGDVAFLPGWSGRNPVRYLADRFKSSVALENDADAAALGEARWGVGRGKRSMICVTVGTGIGGGIVLNGELYRGVDGVHPEIGHHVIQASGPRCFCGATGCWEALASGPAMVEQFLSTAPSETVLRRPITARTICELARQGDACAQRVIEHEGIFLGIGLANLIMLYAPELIVLSGSVMQSAELFWPAIRATLKRNCGLVPSSKVELSTSRLGPHATLLGASVVWHHRHRGA